MNTSSNPTPGAIAADVDTAPDLSRTAHDRPPPSPTISYPSTIEDNDTDLKTVGEPSSLNHPSAKHFDNTVDKSIAPAEQSRNLGTFTKSALSISSQPYEPSHYPDASNDGNSPRLTGLLNPGSMQPSPVDDTWHARATPDPPFHTTGMFCLLYLYSDLMSSGLVEKILISQESFGRFLNVLQPGSYKNVSKIEFASLDQLRVKPVGIYGSKSELAKFMQERGHIDEKTRSLIMSPSNSTPRQQNRLTSGIYALLPVADSSPSNPTEIPIHIMYWPEDTTWDDNASGSVRKNRVTFMRYLTKISDQIYAFLSPEHAKSLVWKDVEEDKEEEEEEALQIGLDDDVENDDVEGRAVDYEVTKTKEMEEGVLDHGHREFHDEAFGRASSNVPHDSTSASTDLPRLILGENLQGCMRQSLLPEKQSERKLDEVFHPARLAQYTDGTCSIVFAEDIDVESVELLLQDAVLRRRLQIELKEYEDSLKLKSEAIKASISTKSLKSHEEIKRNEVRLRDEVNRFLCNRADQVYPPLDLALLEPADSNTTAETLPPDPYELVHHLCAEHSDIDSKYRELLEDPKFDTIKSKAYDRLKKDVLAIRTMADAEFPENTHPRQEFIRRSLADLDLGKLDTEDQRARWLADIVAKIKSTFKSYLKARQPQPSKEFSDDPHFIAFIASPSMSGPNSPYKEVVWELSRYASQSIRNQIFEKEEAFVTEAMLAQLRVVEEKVRCEIDEALVQAKQSLFDSFIQRLRPILNPETHSSRLSMTVHSVRKFKSSLAHNTSLQIKATLKTTSPPRLKLDRYVLHLTEDDTHRVGEDGTYIPELHPRPQTPWVFPDSYHICSLHLLKPDIYLLVAERSNGVGLWLISADRQPIPDRPTRDVPMALNGMRHSVAVDQQSHLVAFVLIRTGSVKVQLYDIGDSYESLQCRGAPYDISQSYPDSTPNIRMACFFAGQGELCLVEDGCVRLFSIPLMMSLLGEVTIKGTPIHAQSAPDGSAVVLVEKQQSGDCQLRILHRKSFGRHNGIIKAAPYFKDATSFAITSIGSRRNLLVAAIRPNHTLFVLRLEIQHKDVEFQLLAKDGAYGNPRGQTTLHNCLIDVFAEIWERYPVVAAIAREAISVETRLPSSITFISADQKDPFEVYFRQMIRAFKLRTHKPTGTRLDKLIVRSHTIDEFQTLSAKVSIFRCGEWLVELLCLIPIHIAVARRNQFIPLKDGIVSEALERQLLGATVFQTVEALTIGWYESIFNFYMAEKPVKVISSMGEQSVGKSYSLNHIVDSSFAGSAMRTTEGVWLSVCPTKKYLVVAMDFEGVHSIERTALEDMFLVLFNAALSNLVLFRNNFALGRDIANMFSSFQASTQFFKPDENHGLFKGRLVIAIKDVTDGDKIDIEKEFSSKFRQIVTSEQATNFLTVLHGDKLTIMPWSVIQSKQFYTLFTHVGRLLFQQPVTHATAGEFLMTLKTLMAQLKARDWGAVDQTVIRHRASLISSILPTALATGYAEVEPIEEPLKNLDNQLAIVSTDTSVQFCLTAEEQGTEGALKLMLDQLKPDAARQPLQDIQSYLQNISELRIGHVKDWIKQNFERFKKVDDNPDITAVWRTFEDTSKLLRSTVRLCLAGCSRCRLKCMKSGSYAHPDHDCGTTHKCTNLCDYLDGHVDRQKLCGLKAGHAGSHICDGAAHVCGLVCHLSTKKGCQGQCTKLSGHIEGLHQCSALFHQCGEPCSLRDIPNGESHLYSCPNLCTRLHNEPHEQHSCEKSLCPLRCELCRNTLNTCDEENHFHGLDPGAIHLCEGEHNCPYQCGAEGICRIDPTPHLVNTTFAGAIETYEYTKFTQEAATLPCAVRLAKGARSHQGPHLHSFQPDATHHCKTRCSSCGYFCHLPYNHPEREHETAHGSMEFTSWAIEGGGDAAVELGGRRFAVEDGGGPQLCQTICRELGRHAHIDYCRNSESECNEPETEHIREPMVPNPERPKDWLTHRLFWTRSTFRDPYSATEQAGFALCNVKCGGQEHRATETNPANPSYCTLPILHRPQNPVDWQMNRQLSHVSGDGHVFHCADPNNYRAAYHVIFVLDKSGSMSEPDKTPEGFTPVVVQIVQRNNNRFGAVVQAVHGFCENRSAALTSQAARRDAYSAVVFDKLPRTQFSNDFTSSPEEIVTMLNSVRAGGGTDFDSALRTAHTLMQTNWSMERSPVIVFLSDGECSPSEEVMYDLCRQAVRLGRPLSFHAVSFGRSRWERSLQRMVDIANEVSGAAGMGTGAPALQSTFTNAINTITLAQTFWDIAESLKKPRNALLRTA